MLMIFIVTVCAVAGVYYLFLYKYSAKAEILVNMGKENVYAPTLPAGGNGLVLNLDQERLVNSEIELLTGRALAERVVKTLGPEKVYYVLDPNATGIRPAFRRLMTAAMRMAGLSPRPPFETAVSWFDDDLSVEAVEKANVVSVSFDSDKPEVAAQVVNTLVGFYVDSHVQAYKSSQTDIFFQGQSQTMKTGLDLAQARLEKFKIENEVTSLDEERTLLLSQESGLRIALNQTESEVADTEKRLAEYRQQMTIIPARIPTAEEIEHNPALIRNLQERLTDLRLKENQYVTNYTGQSRVVEQVRRDIQIVETMLAELKSGHYGKSSTGLNNIYQTIQQKVVDDEALLKGLAAKRETQRAQLRDIRTRLDKLDRIEKDFTRLKQDVTVASGNYKLYLTKAEEARVSHAMDKEKLVNVSLIEPALPPLDPIIGTILAAALILLTGMLTTVGLTFLLEYTDDSLERAEDVEDSLGLPVLTSVPMLKA
jgi:uncharacterized protein involved in exopolysaccharide biosynthesis